MNQSVFVGEHWAFACIKAGSLQIKNGSAFLLKEYKVSIYMALCISKHGKVP